MPDTTPPKLADSTPDGSVASDPIVRFQGWLADATTSEPSDPNAMAVATSTPDGAPSVRMVLLKAVDERGFVFYTNLGSRKGMELAANRQAALLFHWKTLERQVRVEGVAEPVTSAEADAYFASRERLSRLGAWASDQSRPLPSRAELESRLAKFEGRYPGDDIPRPPYWAGFRVIPRLIEFWQGAAFRLHDRTVFTRAENGGWTEGKLYP